MSPMSARATMPARATGTTRPMRTKAAHGAMRKPHQGIETLLLTTVETFIKGLERGNMLLLPVRAFGRMLLHVRQPLFERWR